MQDILKVTQAAMEQDAARLKHIAMNVANASTIGYKRQVHAGRLLGTFEQMMAQGHPAQGIPSTPSPIAPMPSLLIDARPGKLQASERALDMALTGPGYFVVKTPTGLAYTRNGQFRRDESGRLVTLQGGHPVQGTAGDVMLKSDQPVLDTQGALRDGPDEATAGQRLLIQQVPANTEWVHAEGGLLRLSSPDMQASLPPAQTMDGQGVRQFHLEGSNVESLQETLDTMHTMRHFEALHRLTQAVDDMLGTSIKKLGEL